MDHMEFGLEFCEKTLIPTIKNVVDKYVGTSYSIEKKGQGNFVTTVDKKIEQELIDRFQQLVPGSQRKQKHNWSRSLTGLLIRLMERLILSMVCSMQCL